LCGANQVVHLNNGYLWFPSSVDALNEAWAALVKETHPTMTAAALYFSFLAFTALFAFIMPGVEITGRPDVSGNVLKYRCNAYGAWWFSLLVLAILHVSGTFTLSFWYDSIGHVMTCAVLWGDIFALILYLIGLASKNAVRMTGNHVYDYFMGKQACSRFFLLLLLSLKKM